MKLQEPSLKHSEVSRHSLKSLADNLVDGLATSPSNVQMRDRLQKGLDSILKLRDSEPKIEDGFGNELGFKIRNRQGPCHIFSK